MYKMKCLKKHVQLERYEITSITQNSDKFLKIKIKHTFECHYGLMHDSISEHCNIKQQVTICLRLLV